MPKPLVTIIIPNYNHKRFLTQRIESVLNQTEQDFEIILLDDASTDGSQEIIKAYQNHPKITQVILNNVNSGSPFKQWQKGIERAKGEYIWIAESDDFCEPIFLESCLSKLNNDVGLCYTASSDVDTSGNILGLRLDYTKQFTPNIWAQDFILDGRDFVKKYLLVKNVIPNASAVLFKKELWDTFKFKAHLQQFKLCGDWFFWLHLVYHTKIAYLAQPLNYFRTHQSVTRKHKTDLKIRGRIIEESFIRQSARTEYNLYNLEQEFSLRIAWFRNHTFKDLCHKNFYEIASLGKPKWELIPRFIKFLINKDSNKGHKIAILTNKPYEQCETFIKAQIDSLPHNKIHYWGRQVPFKIANKKTKFQKLKTKIAVKDSDGLKILTDNLQRQKVKLVIAHYGMVGTKVLSVCKDLKIPLLVHFHGHDATRSTVLKEYGQQYQNLFKYNRLAVIAVSKKMVQDLKDIGCPPDKIYYNTYGPHPDFAQVEPSYTKKQLLAIGRFVEKKAPKLTIQAFNKVLDQEPNATLVMAGDGDLLEDCKVLVKELDLQSKVQFPGRITPQEFQNYLKESRAFVQHSIVAPDGDSEGTPVAILEASVAGLPVIATSHAGIPDVIIHNETGLLCKEKDIDAMANNMIQVLHNRDLAQKMGQAGKKNIVVNFSFEKHINGLMAIVNKLLIK